MQREEWKIGDEGLGFRDRQIWVFKEHCLQYGNQVMEGREIRRLEDSP